MASYEGTLRCETCGYEQDVYNDGCPSVHLTIEHRTKRDHYLVVRAIEEAAYIADLSASLREES